MGSSRQAYLTPSEAQRVVAAITAAERGHRGEIRVHIERRYPGDGPRLRAAELFGQLGMHATRGGTGVLLYVAVDDRRAAVFAGPGVYEAADPATWQAAVDAVAAGFGRGDRAGGLARAVERIGEVLLRTAPGDDVAGDELPNEVTFS